MTVVAEDRIDHIARVAHEANLAQQRNDGDPSPSLPWDEETGDARQCTIASVRAVLDGATPEELHADWCRRMAAEGWRRGEHKSAADRTHPALVPYAELPESQRVKDAVFAAIVRAMTAAAAKDVRPREGEPRFFDVTCGNCGGEHGTNFAIDQIECPHCEARRCPHCGGWFGEELP